MKENSLINKIKEKLFINLGNKRYKNIEENRLILDALEAQQFIHTYEIDDKN